MTICPHCGCVKTNPQKPGGYELECAQCHAMVIVSDKDLIPMCPKCGAHVRVLGWDR